MNNTKEVGCIEEPSNEIRLPGSVNPEFVRGAGNFDFAKSTPLDANETAGVIGKPTIGLGYGMPSMNANVDINGPTGEVDTTYDHANLSKKYKYPQVHQDVPSLGRNQYNDHS